MHSEALQRWKYGRIILVQSPENDRSAAARVQCCLNPTEQHGCSLVPFSVLGEGGRNPNGIAIPRLRHPECIEVE